jgi:hypothetical protein
MPQFEPFTLEIQWNSAALIIGFTVIILACYILPLLARLMMARTHISV